MDRLNVSLNARRTSVFDHQYQWTIGNFEFCCRGNPGDALTSPIFVIDGTSVQARLKLYPNGVDEHHEDFASLYLELRADGKFQMTAEFRAWIKNTNAIRSGKLENFSTIRVHGFDDFVRRESILDERNEMLANGALTIVCDISVSTGANNHDSTKEIVMASKDSLEGMLRKRKFCDVTLVVEDREFPAHKVILAARSERFDRLFTHNPGTSYFGINDIPVDVVESVLLYLYTGEVYVNGLQVQDFLNVALSYQFMDRDLKSKIEDEVLIAQIDASNAAELLVIAYDYNLDKLYHNILEFVCSRRAEVVQSEGFRRVVEARPDFFAKNGITLVINGIA